MKNLTGFFLIFVISLGVLKSMGARNDDELTLIDLIRLDSYIIKMSIKSRSTSEVDM